LNGKRTLHPAIVVIGGGIFGASIASHLGARGIGKEVLLLERSEIAAAASSQAAGMIFRISAKPGVDALSRATFEGLPLLEQQLGEALDFRRVGTVRCAVEPDGRAALAALRQRAVQAGAAAETIDAAWCRRAMPWLEPGDAACVYFADDGYIDPYRLTAAYARAAAQSGVRIQTGATVRSIRLQAGRVAGLETSAGKIACDTLVVAAGALSNHLTVPLGIALPMAPTRSHYWITAADSLFDAAQPMLVHTDAGIYTRPELNGLLIGVHEAASRTFDYRRLPDDLPSFQVTQAGTEWDVLLAAEDRIQRFLPTLNTLRFADYVAGLSTYTPDSRFVIGPVKAVPGLYAAGGCCGSGVTISGGVGEALAGLIVEGRSPHDLSPFLPERFGGVDPSSEDFQQRCASARAGKSALQIEKRENTNAFRDG